MITIEHGFVEVDGQFVSYQLREVDVGSDARQGSDPDVDRPVGEPVVVLPGHGQTVASPIKLTGAAAALSGAGIAWCIDILAPGGGDPIKARALSLIVRRRFFEQFLAVEGSVGVPPVPRATLIGWSHGGGEALRSAQHDPELFPRVAGLCPAELIERRPAELLLGFLLEVMRIVWKATIRRDWAGLRDGFRVGFDILRGMWRDLIHGRSLQRVLDDIRWASRKAPGQDFEYGGKVAIVFARDDTVIRWQAVFPDCAAPEDIPARLNDYRRADFPRTAGLQVAVLEGDHLSPESAAEEYARQAFELLGL